MEASVEKKKKRKSEVDQLYEQLSFYYYDKQDFGIDSGLNHGMNPQYQRKIAPAVTTKETKEKQNLETRKSYPTRSSLTEKISSSKIKSQTNKIPSAIVKIEDISGNCKDAKKMRKKSEIERLYDQLSFYYFDRNKDENKSETNLCASRKVYPMRKSKNSVQEKDSKGFNKYGSKNCKKGMTQKKCHQKTADVNDSSSANIHGQAVNLKDSKKPTNHEVPEVQLNKQEKIDDMGVQLFSDSSALEGKQKNQTQCLCCIEDYSQNCLNNNCPIEAAFSKSCIDYAKSASDSGDIDDNVTQKKDKNERNSGNLSNTNDGIAQVEDGRLNETESFWRKELGQQNAALQIRKNLIKEQNHQGKPEATNNHGTKNQSIHEEDIVSAVNTEGLPNTHEVNQGVHEEGFIPTLNRADPESTHNSKTLKVFDNNVVSVVSTPEILETQDVGNNKTHKEGNAVAGNKPMHSVIENSEQSGAKETIYVISKHFTDESNDNDVFIRNSVSIDQDNNKKNNPCSRFPSKTSNTTHNSDESAITSAADFAISESSNFNDAGAHNLLSHSKYKNNNCKVKIDGINLNKYSYLGKRKCFLDATERFRCKKRSSNTTEEGFRKGLKGVSWSGDFTISESECSTNNFKSNFKTVGLNLNCNLLGKHSYLGKRKCFIDAAERFGCKIRKVDSRKEYLRKGLNSVVKGDRDMPIEILDDSSDSNEECIEALGPIEEDVIKIREALRKNQASSLRCGDLIIGKLKGYDWWFGKIIKKKTKQKSQGLGSCWVRWYGDNKLSEMDISNLEDMSMFKTRLMPKKLKGLYFRAVIEVLEAAAARCSKKFENVGNRQDYIKSLIEWGKSGFEPEGIEALSVNSEDVDSSKTQSGKNNDEESVHSDEEEDPLQPSLCDAVKSLFDAVAEGRTCIEELCLSCGDTNIVTAHPLFEGGLCKECKETFMEGVYLYDENGQQMYCCICNDGEQIILCDRPGCSRSYCSICLDMFCGKGYMYKISRLASWECFLCTGKSVRILKGRPDWQDRLKILFQTGGCSDWEFSPPIFYDTIPFSQRKPIRVLALFDGIATGYLVLKELGIDIELYAAAEIDEQARLVSQVRHGENIRHIGDVQKLRRKDIEELGPFDLVMGGSPCNDLSICNPNRKGIYDGTGRLFFDFHRLVNYAMPNPINSRPFFWFFENVVGMRYSDREIISRFLECRPVVISAKDVSAQYRTRYFWGNLPGMGRSLTPLPNDKLKLQDCLEPKCGRVAKVDKVGCITTRLNSVKQTKHLVLPVECKSPVGEHTEDVLWVTEVERIFGFPEHYTDVGNMSRGHRQRLLGKAWSVPVVRHILSPLRNYFKSKNVEVEND